MEGNDSVFSFRVSSVSFYFSLSLSPSIFRASFYPWTSTQEQRSSSVWTCLSLCLGSPLRAGSDLTLDGFVVGLTRL